MVTARLATTVDLPSSGPAEVSRRRRPGVAPPPGPQLEIGAQGAVGLRRRRAGSVIVATRGVPARGRCCHRTNTSTVVALRVLLLLRAAPAAPTAPARSLGTARSSAPGRSVVVEVLQQEGQRPRRGAPAGRAPGASRRAGARTAPPGSPPGRAPAPRYPASPGRRSRPGSSPRRPARGVGDVPRSPGSASSTSIAMRYSPGRRRP